MEVTVNVNGTEHTADVEPRLLLVHLIREDLGLTGTHIGCDTSNCGACTVLLDGTPVKSCTMFARPGRRPRGHDGRGPDGGRRRCTRSRRRSRRSTGSSAASARRG